MTSCINPPLPSDAHLLSWKTNNTVLAGNADLETVESLEERKKLLCDLSYRLLWPSLNGQSSHFPLVHASQCLEVHPDGHVWFCGLQQ
mmetsp:Transcript_28113/g.67722  ORF Transcript_28113/g.67722 Transcript_28113/m.67722 type:complete len:88 (-) Transcript_28113:54-317(-)